MRSKTVTRYYCDHCNKGMFRKPQMERHEAICFKNANRRCAFCDNNSMIPTSPETLAECKGLDEMKQHTECPACLTAGIIAWRAKRPTEDWFEWDYVAEKKEFDHGKQPQHYPICNCP